MRTQPYKFEKVGPDFAIDKNEVGADVAVTMVLPVACKGVIAEPIVQRQVGSQKIQDGDKNVEEVSAVAGTGFTLEVFLES